MTLYLKDLYRARNTVLEMLLDRGYKLTGYKKILSKQTFEQFKEQSNIDIHIKNYIGKTEPYEILETKKKTVRNDIFVKFLYTKKIRPSYIREILLDIYKMSKDVNIKIILILKEKPNNTILKIIKDPRFCELEIFWLKCVVFNITQHSYVPEHIPITDEDTKQQIMEKHNITHLKQLPLILKSDPITKYYNLKSGDVFKVIRHSKTSGVSTLYRYVK